MLKALIHILCFCFVSVLYGQDGDFEVLLDSIQELRRLSRNEKLDIDTRLKYGERASNLSHKTNRDSIILKSDYYLTYLYQYNQKNFDKAKILIQRNIELAKNLDDYRTEAISNIFLAYIYRQLQIHNDSAYYYNYKALKILESFNNLSREEVLFRKANIYSNIGSMQIGELNYIDSQSSIIKAIELLKSLSDNNLENKKELCNLYILLGLTSSKLKEYKESLSYYCKGLEISKQIEDIRYFLYLKIDIAQVYKDLGTYEEVFKIYNELLEDKRIEKKDPSSYATILINLAYTKHLSGDKDYKKIDSLFTNAYSIFEKLNLSYELSASGNDIAEFYYTQDKKDKALHYTKRSYKLGKEIKRYEEVFRSLKMLSKLKPGDSGKAYLQEYITLKDSLIDVERVNRNKFARIKYETDHYEQETKRLSHQNLLIGGIAAVLVLITVLLYFIKQQSTKHKLLLYKQEQQQAGQEIYKLMLTQQEKQEEGRLEERHRISEEMHDGILSHLFGTRLGLAFLNIDSDDATKTQFKKLLDELQEVEKEIRDISHQLKKDESITKANYASLLKQYIGTQSTLGGFAHTITTNVDWTAIPDTIKVGLYRILQEALKNIIKHAKATKLSVTFNKDSDQLYVTIADDGVGFDTSTAANGIGLKNISSRVAQLKGSIDITSQINKGTELKLTIPITP